MVACALCFNPENKPSKQFLEKINDSKKISEKKREELYRELIKMSINVPPYGGGCLKDRGSPQLFF
ncbi:hypothetical protein HOG21_03315 [bacterium]|nr:hypothetical protein [bacterium]